MPIVFIALWSTAFIVARYAMPCSPPMKFLALRFFLSAICFFIWIALTRTRSQVWKSNLVHWQPLVVSGILTQAGYAGGVWSAVRAGMGSGLISLLIGLHPLLSAAWISWRGRGLSRREILGMFLGFLGLAIVVWPKLGRGEVTVLNFTYALIGLFSITAGTLYQKYAVKPGDFRIASVIQLLAATLVTGSLAFFESGPMLWQPQLIGALLWSIVALSLGAYSLFYILIQRKEATSVSSYLFLVPPTTSVIAWMLFREPYTIMIFLGTALTASGVSLVALQKKT